VRGRGEYTDDCGEGVSAKFTVWAEVEGSVGITIVVAVVAVVGVVAVSATNGLVVVVVVVVVGVSVGENVTLGRSGVDVEEDGAAVGREETASEGGGVDVDNVVGE
jgi:hypothetical protein